MNPSVADLDALLSGPAPVLALAPMQDVTDLPFWQLMTQYGGADVYYTEYFRVHPDSNLEKPILRSVVENPTGRPVAAQMIGNDIPSLVRTARELQEHDVAAVDLNLGCPAPVVYKKCAGGGLLRDLPQVDAILGALRETVVKCRFTVKTRIGFDDASVFEKLLPLFKKHGIDLLTVHGRTVREMYRSEVHYDYIARAVAEMDCPVLANGNVSSAFRAADILDATRARGLMIGRGAIRNPWIFQQVRAHLAGGEVLHPAGYEVLDYVHTLYERVTSPEVPEKLRVQKMKKYLNFLGLGVEPTGSFLHAMRRAVSRAELFAICARHLDHGRPMTLEPFALDLKEVDVMAGAHA